MANYSVTLNFFLPKKIVEALQAVKVSGNFSFDWRNSEACHCTVKAISLSDIRPEKELLNEWIVKSKKILDTQKSFSVKIKDVAKFPTAVFAGVESHELLRLHKKLFDILPSSQPQFEGKHYVPHASIGVINDDVKLLSGHGQTFGEFEVNEMQLIIWDLKALNEPVICHTFSLDGTS